MAYRYEKNKEGVYEIVVDGCERGISDSPYQMSGQYSFQNNSGMTDLRCVNIVSVPGEASVAFSTVTQMASGGTGNVLSADAGADTISFNTFQPINGQTIFFTGGSLPAGITAGSQPATPGSAISNPYWVLNLNVGAGTFQVSDSYINYLAGTPVNITGTGTGTFVNLTMALPKFIDQVTGSYLIDANGLVWGVLSDIWYYFGNTTLTNANGNGISSYLGTFLFIFRNNKIDYMTIASKAWTYGWATLLNTNVGGSSTQAGNNYVHQPVVNTTGSGILYIPDGNVLAKIVQTGDSTSIGTYTFTDSILLLPFKEVSTCVSVLGTNLLVGGQSNIVYQWDRTSTGYVPIYIAESNVINIVSVNQNAYIFAGFRGRIYICNGSQASLYKKVPDHISGTIEPYFTWGGATSNRNQLYFGVKATTNAGGAISQYGGVWAIDLDTTAMRLAMKLSYATYAGYSTALYASTGTSVAGFGLAIGWDSGASTYGVDQSSNTPYTGGQSVIVSDLIPVGTAIRPQTFEQVEFKLTRPLVSGETVQLLMGSSLNDYFNNTWTSLGTFSTVGQLSGYFPITLEKNQWLILEAVLTGTASSPSYVRLRELRVR